jgi:hypothetical protein
MGRAHITVLARDESVTSDQDGELHTLRDLYLTMLTRNSAAMR